MTKNILIVKEVNMQRQKYLEKLQLTLKRALKARGYNTTSIEPQDNLIRYLNDNKENIDIIFNALHGPWGEDGKIQGLFEYFSISILILA